MLSAGGMLSATSSWEHGEGQQHRDPEGHLLPGVGGQVEAQRGEEGDEEAGQEQVEDVERGAALQMQGIGDFSVRVRAAAVHHDVSNRGHAVTLPLHVLHEVGQVSTLHAQTDVHLCRGHGERCWYRRDTNMIMSYAFLCKILNMLHMQGINFKSP